MKKNRVKRNVVVLIVALVVLAVSGVLGIVLGAFRNVGDVLGMIHLDGETVFRLLAMIAFLVAVHAILQLLFHLLQKGGNRTRTLSTVLSSLVRYVAVLVGICWGLSLLGVNVGTIFAGVGIVALIVGFGAESLIADLVTGAFILFENQYNVGDIVELDGFRGTVDNIGIRTTGIRDAGGNLKIVNNSDIKNIVNRSESGSVAIATVGISYGLNLEDVEKKLPAILEKIKARHEDIFVGDVRYLGVEELADSAVVLKFMADVNEKDVFSGRRLLNRELKVCFDEAGLEIAYPQVDVHMR